MSEYDLPTTMNSGALLLALLGILAVVMLAILRQRADADTAAPQSPAPARPCLCGHGALDHDDNGDCAGVYTYGRRVVLCTCTHYLSCNDRTIRRLISAGKLEAFRLGDHAIRLDRNQIDARIEAHPVRQGGDDEVTR